MENSLHHLNYEFLGGKRKYLASNDYPTIADIIVYYDIEMLNYVNYDLTKHKFVYEWMNKLGQIK